MKLRNQMQTFSGERFDFDDPSPDAIKLSDIAEHLSKLCRFNGACLRFYSVAEHCVHVSNAVSQRVAFEGLMHDAAEAYTGDIVRYLKRKIRELAPGALEAFEHSIEAIIAKKFRLVYPWPAEVKEVDLAVCAAEKEQIMAPPKFEWNPLPDPTPGVEVQGWIPSVARVKFMAQFALVSRKGAEDA